MLRKIFLIKYQKLLEITRAEIAFFRGKREKRG